MSLVFQANSVRVHDDSSFRSALLSAKPGTTILVAPGDYRGGFHVQRLSGTASMPIIVKAEDRARKPRIVGGGSGLQLSSVSHLQLDGLKFEGATGNGLNIDDGGTGIGTTHHIKLKNLEIRNIPPGNRDAIKLSGIDDFEVTSCHIEKWGGSGIDMVGCHRGLIEGNRFSSGGDSGVQAKGGTSNVRILANRFESAGQRSVNIGGSTGLQFFRPAVSAMPPNGRYEAKDIEVSGNVFLGSMSPIAFVGVDGAVVKRNTIYMPERWAIRILQETREPGFVPSRKGVFERNLVAFRSNQWSSGGLNVGPGTAATTFSFRRNFWFCSDNPRLSKPNLPVPESDGSYGIDPLFSNAPSDLTVRKGSPAADFGAGQGRLNDPRKDTR